jgi:hypothetical protein
VVPIDDFVQKASHAAKRLTMKTFDFKFLGVLALDTALR